MSPAGRLSRNPLIKKEPFSEILCRDEIFFDCLSKSQFFLQISRNGIFLVFIDYFMIQNNFYTYFTYIGVTRLFYEWLSFKNAIC
jgi:hypothetical protein